MNGKEDRKSDSLYSGNYVCGECGKKKIRTTKEIYKFPYGVGDDMVELSCEVPIRTCDDCGFRFIDSEAEDICHETICKHLGVMTPTQIKALRELYDLTQAQFSEITKLGEATLSRWERGIIIQNNAYDNYLYLLGFNENFERVIKRSKTEIPKGFLPVKKEPSFRAIEKVTEELRKRQEEFELQLC